MFPNIVLTGAIGKIVLYCEMMECLLGQVLEANCHNLGDVVVVVVVVELWGSVRRLGTSYIHIRFGLVVSRRH